MYSKNDYRYYLEDQLIHSDDFLAHYGVKGMKWKKHKTGGLKDVFDLMGQNSRKLLSDPKNATKDVRNVVNGTRKRSLGLAREDNVRGVKKTEHARNEKRNRSLNGYSERKTKTAPNMYTTRNKGKYSDDPTGHTITVSTGGKTYVTKTYGQLDKKADMKADKKMRRDYINQQNPYSYDKKKSLKKNVESNKKVARKRKALKQRAYRKVDEQYRNV